MRVLIAFERSGVVREAMRKAGCIAWSCDLEPSERSNDFHWRGDALKLLIMDRRWDLVIAHPPCTYLCSSGLHHNARSRERAQKTEESLRFTFQLIELLDGIPRWCIENPIGLLGTHWRKPDQIIQPWQFGHDASKATCLWLHGLTPLHPTELIRPRIVNGRPLWSNQTPSGQNRMGKSKSRAARRSKTYQGIAEAMARQWATPLL